MTQKINTGIRVGDNAGFYFDKCAETVQTGGILKMLSRAVLRLRLWAAAQLIAHENRTFELSVYRRSRVDSPLTVDAET